jgi:hypothetical protein
MFTEIDNDRSATWKARYVMGDLHDQAHEASGK